MSIVLSKLLENDINNDSTVQGICLDSRKVQPGYVFCAYQGHKINGNHFIQDALNKGAVAILTDATSASLKLNTRVPIITIKNLKLELSRIAANFYGHPSKSMKVIGVTGTNGKTSFCHFLAQALTELGVTTGVLGTLGNGIYGQHEKSNLTTSDPIEVQAMLKKMLEQGAQYVAMEVSSHGMIEGRVSAVEFDTAVFTNLSRDHLDFHGDMMAYGRAKRKLFEKEGVKHIVINIDDEFGCQLLEELSTKISAYAYSAEGRISELNVPTIRAEHVHLNMNGITASLHSPWCEGLLHSGLLGRFNLSNLLAVFTVLGLRGFSEEAVFTALARVKGVTGRMQLFNAKDKAHIVIDYAHTPDALKQVLSTLRDYTTGELWCVFGCGGDRDQGKRSQMGQIAESYADYIVVTDDNPRQEDPSSIISDILQGMQNPKRAVVEHNRRRAIAHAVNCAKTGDIVLIAGKGHENYQIYGSEYLPFSDAVEVQLLLTEKQ